MEERDTPWQRTVEQVAADVGTDVVAGLTSSEAAARLVRDGPNELASSPPVPVWRRLLAQTREPLVLLLLVAAAISLVAWAVDGASGAPIDVIVILTIVVANAVLGYVQQAKAEEAVEALRRMTDATSTVVRDGQVTTVPSRELVRGDLLVLAEGDAVGADARLVESASLMVAEAALTGESEPVLKSTLPIAHAAGPGDRFDMVMNGTAVTRGRGRAIVTATGMGSEVGRVATLLDATTETATPLETEVAAIGRALGAAVIVIALVVVGAILLTSDVDTASDLVDVLLIGVSLAVAAVPEGLPAVLSVVLALGVQRMAAERAVVKRLAAVEALGSASVVCTDKTGTLTRNEMTITRVLTPSGEVDVTGSGYLPDGEVRHDGGPLVDPALRDEVAAVVVGGCLSNDASLRRTDDGSWVVEGDPTEAAFLVAERKLGEVGDLRRARFDRIGELPFTSERKLMSTLQADADTGGVAVVTKGAPDVLVARCSHERRAGHVVPLDERRRAEVLAEVDRLAGDALRTLAVAYRPLDPDDADAPADERIEHGLVYLGVVGIIDPPRLEARRAVAEATRAGVRVVMITGDHPTTAQRIARELGITQDGGPDPLLGTDLTGMSQRDLVAAARDVTVYARVAPEHKLRIVGALQADGGIVAMTGDGVNDAPALKAADIGVAMGITGTDVSKEAADVILADDRFDTIVSAVRNGRAIFSNIRKFLRFLLSSNIGEVLTMFFGVVLAGWLGVTEAGDGVAVPLLATQILWINLLTDAAPALAIGVDPPADDLMDRPPRRPGDRVIDARMWGGIAFVGVVMALVTLLALDLHLPGGLVDGNGSLAAARTAAFTTLVLAQLFNALNARSEDRSALHRLFANRWLWSAIVGSAALQVAVVHVGFLNEAFGTVPLTVGEWMRCVALASVVLWAVEGRKALLRWRAVSRAARAA